VKVRMPALRAPWVQMQGGPTQEARSRWAATLNPMSVRSSLLPFGAGRRRRRAALAGGLLLLAASAADSRQSAPPEPSPILAFYDFEQPEPTGPHTFRLFEEPRGGLDLSDELRVSGARSLRLREGRGDGAFTEFLGYFPERRDGLLAVQFWFLLPEPAQPFNFALAGPRWFLAFERDGHAVWIAGRDGRLAHRPAGEWRDLFELRAFTWYFVDLVYDPPRGVYALRISEEGIEEPLVDLRSQRNTADSDESAVRFLSLIGDLEDRGSATVFVDDLLIATDPDVRLDPFVAPGRRRFFVELHPAPGGVPEGVERDDLLAEARRWLVTQSAVGPPTGPLDEERAARLERAADAAFLGAGPASLAQNDPRRGRDLDLAEQLYGILREAPGRSWRALLKLSDVYFLRGDLEGERRAREAIFGGLRLAEERQRELAIAH